MDDSAVLMLNVLFSAIGMGYFMYGKKQKQLIPALCGGALMVYPYFIVNLWAMLAIGVALMLVPKYVSV